MAVLGLLILAAAAALTVDVVLENTKKLAQDPMVLGQSVGGLRVGTLFLAGVVVGVLGLLGLSLILAGLRRARRRRVERKELDRNYQGAAGSAGSLQEERDRLAGELERERAGRRAEHEGRGLGHGDEGETREVRREPRDEGDVEGATRHDRTDTESGAERRD